MTEQTLTEKNDLIINMILRELITDELALAGRRLRNGDDDLLLIANQLQKRRGRDGSLGDLDLSVPDYMVDSIEESCAGYLE